MCKASWQTHLPTALFAQLDSHVTAEGRAVLSHVDGDVKHLAVYDSHQLALCLRVLDVEAAQHAARRAGEIVLQEGRLIPQA